MARQVFMALKRALRTRRQVAGYGARRHAARSARARRYAAIAAPAPPPLAAGAPSRSGSRALRNPLAIVSGLLGNAALLASTLQTRASAVSRDEAVLSRSTPLGATHRDERGADR
jgi:hypothetical protein